MFSQQLRLLNASVHKRTGRVVALPSVTGRKLTPAPSFEDRAGKILGLRGADRHAAATKTEAERFPSSQSRSDNAQPWSKSRRKGNAGCNSARWGLDHRERGCANEFKTWVLVCVRVSLSLISVFIFVFISLYMCRRSARHHLD